MTFDLPYLKAAHQVSIRNRTEIEAGDLCGCFYCLATFKPDAIEEWLDEDVGTALCPECGIDSVIGAASGYPIDDPAFLKAMNKRWFSSDA